MARPNAPPSAGGCLRKPICEVSLAVYTLEGAHATVKGTLLGFNSYAVQGTAASFRGPLTPCLEWQM